MNSLYETCIYFCAIAFIAGTSLVQAKVESSRAETSANKGQFSAARLGRGLQMLRLGKRSVNLDSLNPDQANSHLTSNDVQAVLASIFDQPRDESRRQPPLPRYGRDSNNNVKGRLLDDAMTDNSGVYQADFFPLSSQRFFFRPAPRGGRYRKSVPAGRLAYGSYISQDSVDRARALAFPRFDQFIEELSHLQPKAVPRPRIGRYQNDQDTNSFQAKLV
uniref:Myomodulin 2 n=1 Tax=Deroceras reticulatum TaxID=145610 RepID=A0A1X9WEE5_DERRE|nr:myomodulin 2 [Deroceras reticulatum]QRC76231.1 myomodulin 2 [Deroceras reticulatum]